MNGMTGCFAAVLGFGLVYGPALAAAQDVDPRTTDASETEMRSSVKESRTAGQRRADRAVLTLQQDAHGRIVPPAGGQTARPLTPNDPEITRSPAPSTPYDVIRL